MKLCSYPVNLFIILSLPTRGEWVEIDYGQATEQCHGQSLPTRGEWVEISVSSLIYASIESLPTRGEWVEIYLRIVLTVYTSSLSPHGESGLK